MNKKRLFVITIVFIIAIVVIVFSSNTKGKKEKIFDYVMENESLIYSAIDKIDELPLRVLLNYGEEIVGVGNSKIDKYTDDVDAEGNPNNNGLYENVADDGQYVEAFTKWAVDSSRKPGDTGIVQTEYGFHVMFYVKANDDAWYASVKNAIFTDKYAKATDDVLFAMMSKMDFNSTVLNWAEKNQNDFIAKIVMNNY